MSAGNTLFRKEAILHRSSRLHGDVSMAVPVSWQVIGFALAATLVIAAAFLAIGTYARVETVPGLLAPDAGVAVIVSPRSGVVLRVAAKEGARVRAGAPLVVLGSEERLSDGTRPTGRMRDALIIQDRQLAEQGAAMLRAAAAERSQLEEQILGLKSAVNDIDQQIADQLRLVAVSTDEFRDVAVVAERGFISKRDLASREAILLQRRQQLSQLRQSRSEKQAELAGARKAIGQSLANGQAQSAGAGSSRTALAQQMAQIDQAEGFTLTSPVDGVVTAVTARPGQAASAQQSLLMVVPDNARLRAELMVPTTAAGFIARGQDVRLAIDAFPYQRFGTISARIVEVAGAATTQREADGRAVPAYLVVVDLPKPWVEAFGRRQPLIPGMTLSARIVTERQSLLHWLFEPLFAVRTR